MILGQIAAMQKQLKDDEELVVTFQQGMERIRVMEIFLASPQVAVLIGPDAHRSLTRIVAAVGLVSVLVSFDFKIRTQIQAAAKLVAEQP